MSRSWISLSLSSTGVVKFSHGMKLISDATWSDSSISLRDYWDPKTKICLSTDVVADKYKLPPTIENFNVGLLKSGLQKAIRRGKVESAVAIGWQLLCQDKIEFLRRLPIIALEDVILHPDFPQLVWIMMSITKGYNMTKNQCLLLMKIVRDLASSQYRDYIPKLEKFKSPLSESSTNTHDAFIATVILRANWGGMLGDVDFLLAFSMIWSKRFETDSSLWKGLMLEVYPIDMDAEQNLEELIEKQPRLDVKHRIPEAVDQHTFPQLINLVRQACNNRITNDDISSAVWNHSSGINLKKYVTTTENPYKIEKSSESTPNELESYSNWKIIQREWQLLISGKYWDPIPLELIDTKKRKEIPKNEKITKFFKLV